MSLEISIGSQLSKNSAETTLSLEELIIGMSESGMDKSQIKNVLMNDLNSGGRLFGAFRNNVKNTVKNGMNIAAGESSRGTFEEAGVQEYRWVSSGDASVCPDCLRRHGDVESMEFWKNVGLPASGFSLCRFACNCQLVPETYKGENLDEPLLRKKTKPSKQVVEDEKINTILQNANVGAQKVLGDMKAFARHSNTPDSMLLGLAEEYGITGSDAHHLMNYVKNIPDDLERYLKTPPRLLDSFDSSMKKWTFGVDVEGRDSAAMTFWDFEDVRNYTQSELIIDLRRQGYKIQSLETFRQSRHKIYRVGGTQQGYNSFFMNKEQAFAYQKRMGLDSISEYDVYGDDIIPTRSGAGEVVVNADDVLSETLIDVG
tara:strand:+ start:2287 stop:3402 length:1116 start_codon:yes stop_codon:yes gene_type:complete